MSPRGTSNMDTGGEFHMFLNLVLNPQSNPKHYFFFQYMPGEGGEESGTKEEAAREVNKNPVTRIQTQKGKPMNIG